MNALIRINSELGIDYREELEKLFFFNPQQAKCLSGIRRSIDRYGVPSLETQGNWLRIKVEGLRECQTLFALDHQSDPPTLAGVMVYCRTDVEDVVLLHMAVREEYTSRGIRADEMLAVEMVAVLRDTVRRIKGVKSITLPYAGLMIHEHD